MTLCDNLLTMCDYGLIYLSKGVASRLQAVVGGASALLDFYYSVGGLVLIKVINIYKL